VGLADGIKRRRSSPDNLAIQMPGRVTEHRQHDGEADEKGQSADQQRAGDDEGPHAIASGLAITALTETITAR